MHTGGPQNAREGESTRAFITRYTNDTLQILGLPKEHHISWFVHGLRTRSLVEFLSTDVPTTYKGLMEKTSTWIEEKDVATNGAPNDKQEAPISSQKFLRIIRKGKQKNRSWATKPTSARAGWGGVGVWGFLGVLRHQIKEAVKSKQLAHLVKGIKKGKEKTFDTQLDNG
ncbi:hypothetical protein Tco_0371128 [Tanacetum coccineum]